MPNIRLTGFDDTINAALVELLPQLGFSCGKEPFAVQLALGGYAVEHADLPTLYMGGEAPGALQPPLHAQRLAQAIRQAAMTRQIPLGGGWHADLGARTLNDASGTTAASLTEKECAVLEYLYNRGGQPASREELLQEVWGYADDIATHTLESHMHRLRSKLNAAMGSDECILTTESGYSIRS